MIEGVLQLIQNTDLYTWMVALAMFAMALGALAATPLLMVQALCMFTMLALPMVMQVVLAMTNTPQNGRPDIPLTLMHSIINAVTVASYVVIVLMAVSNATAVYKQFKPKER